MREFSELKGRKHFLMFIMKQSSLGREKAREIEGNWVKNRESLHSVNCQNIFTER